MRSQMGGLRAAFKADKLRSVTGNSEQIAVNLEENVIEWDTLFRRNWDIYVEFFLGIPLRPFQRQAIHELGVSDVFFWRAGRGGSKSFCTMIAAVCKLLLFPNCQIVITSSTIDQANKMIKEKLEKELIKKLSPVLLYYYENDWIKITKPTDGYYVECTLNNSSISVLAPVESARGSRSNFTIYDEVAIMKKTSIDQIFDGMLFPRQPNYLNNPEYAGKKRWLEESKSIYLTSSKFKYQWWYRLWCDCVTGYYTDKKTKYGIFATDFFDNIDNGLKTWGDYRRARRQNDDMSFRMEYLNEAIGNAEDAFFDLKSFKENQTLEQCFKPPTPMQLYLGYNNNNPEKQDNEIRIIASDFAFANTTTKQKNDNTIILFMSLHWKKGHFERHLDYIVGHPASDTLGAADRIRELIYDYQADYYALDLRNGGEVLFNYLTMPKENEVRGRFWNSHGLGLCDKRQYQVAPNTKLDDLEARTVDKDPIRCMIPIIGTSELNSLIWAELKKQLECNNIKFLYGAQDKQTAIEEAGLYYDYTAESLAEELLPYGQTDELIQEAVNLKGEFKNDRIKLVEPRSGTKDRVVILGYCNYIASLIENEWNKQDQDTEVDLTDVQLVW